MLSFLHIECPACESTYMLSAEELNILVLFRCSGCGQDNVYVAGQVLALDSDIMQRGADMERRSHIVETLQHWASEFAGDVLSNVGRVIDINMNADLSCSDSWDCNLRRKEEEGAREILKSKLLPTVLWVDAPQITEEEVRDFANIDLNLIDRPEYFNRFFGGHRGQ